MRVVTKRVYDSPDPADGQRILVDRLWPRGISKTDLRLDYWAKLRDRAQGQGEE